MLISLSGLVIGLRKFKGQSPLIIRIQPNMVLVERTIQGAKQFISIRNYSNLTFRNCIVFCNNNACNWIDSDSSYPRDIRPGEAVIVEIIDLDKNSMISIKSNNETKTTMRLNTMNGPSSLKFN